MFVQNILSNYGGDGFDNNMHKIQEEVKKRYNVEISLEKCRRDFFREFDKLIYKTIWEFLKDEDKKELGIIENLEIDEMEKVKFIEFYSDKVKKLAESSRSDGQAVEAIAIHTFIAKHLGRSVEEIAQMDELTVINVLKEIIQIVKEERAEKVNTIAVATAFASGNKSAKSQITKINNEAKRSRSTKNVKTESMVEATSFSRDEMRRLINGR